METKTTLPVEKIYLNAAQSDIYTADTSKIKIILGTAGEQAGKTTIGVLWLMKQVRKHWDEYPYNYIIGANTYKVMKQSTKEKFDEIFTGYWGNYVAQDDYFQLRKDGKPWGRIYFRSQGMDKKSAGDSFIGIPDCKAGLGDEVGKWTRQFYLRFKGRLGRLNGAFCGIGTPYAQNFIKSIADRFRKGDSHIMYRAWTCYDNPSYDASGIEELKRELSPTEFKRLVLGEITKAEGLVHEAWGELNYCDERELPRGTVYVGGQDWGSNHPFAQVIIGVTPNEGCFIVSVVKKSRLSAGQQLDLIEAKNKIYRPRMWFAGHDRPEMIEEVKNRGIPMVKYFELDTAYREIVSGDSLGSQWIRTNQMKIFRGIDGEEDWTDEVETYVWDQKDEDENQGREKPVDKNNDLMAAYRYACVGIQTMGLLRFKKEEYKMRIDEKVKVDRYKPPRPQKDWSSY